MSKLLYILKIRNEFVCWNVLFEIAYPISIYERTTSWSASKRHFVGDSIVASK